MVNKAYLEASHDDLSRPKNNLWEDPLELGIEKANTFWAKKNGSVL